MQSQGDHLLQYWQLATVEPTFLEEQRLLKLLLLMVGEQDPLMKEQQPFVLSFKLLSY